MNALKSMPPPDDMARILSSVVIERARQEQLRLERKFRATCATIGPDQMTEFQCFTVLGEEVGEVGRACLDMDDMNKCNADLRLREELIQVAAVCVAWVERLDAGGPIL